MKPGFQGKDIMRERAEQELRSEMKASGGRMKKGGYAAGGASMMSEGGAPAGLPEGRMRTMRGMRQPAVLMQPPAMKKGGHRKATGGTVSKAMGGRPDLRSDFAATKAAYERDAGMPMKKGGHRKAAGGAISKSTGGTAMRASGGAISKNAGGVASINMHSNGGRIRKAAGGTTAKAMGGAMKRGGKAKKMAFGGFSPMDFISPVSMISKAVNSLSGHKKGGAIRKAAGGASMKSMGGSEPMKALRKGGKCKATGGAAMKASGGAMSKAHGGGTFGIMAPRGNMGPGAANRRYSAGGTSKMAMGGVGKERKGQTERGASKRGHR